MGTVAFVCGTMIIPPTSLPPRGGARLVILGNFSRLGDQDQPKGEETGSTATDTPRVGVQLCRRQIVPLETGRRMRRPYTDMPPTRPVLRAGAFHGRRCFRLRDHDYSPHISSAARRGRRPLGDPWYPELGFSVGRSGSTQGGRNRIDGHRRPFRGSVCNFVDVRGRQIVPLEVFTTMGDACVAPTQTCPRQDPVLRAGAFHGRRCFRLRDHDYSPHISSAARRGRRPLGDPWYPEPGFPVGRSGSTQGGKNSIDGHRGPFRGSVCNFVDVRGRQIVPL